MFEAEIKWPWSIPAFTTSSFKLVVDWKKGLRRIKKQEHVLGTRLRGVVVKAAGCKPRT